MKKSYLVNVSFYGDSEFEICAESKEEAEEKAKSKFENGSIIPERRDLNLDAEADLWGGTEFECEEDEE